MPDVVPDGVVPDGVVPDQEGVAEDRTVVRRAGADDAGGLSRLAGRSFPEACPESLSAEDLEAYISTELTPQRFAQHLREHFVLVVDDPQRAGELRGYAMLCLVEPPVQLAAENPVELKRIYADPAAIGSGVGAAMMRSSLEAARQRGHDAVWLGTNQRNARAIGFYRRFGFEVVGERTFQVGSSTEADFVLACPLPAR